MITYIFQAQGTLKLDLELEKQLTTIYNNQTKIE